MNKLSKLTALLLAIVLALGVPMQVMAEGEDTAVQDAIDTLTDYLKVADTALYKTIMGFTKYSDYWEIGYLLEDEDVIAYIANNDAERVKEIQDHLDKLWWEGCVSYTGNPGPLMPPVDTGAATYALRAMTRDVNPGNGLELTKTAKDNNNGTYTITLEAYAEGNVTQKVEGVPVDIVLVLDYSSSMKNNFGSVPAITALRQAVSSFINTIGKKYDEKTANHRISIVLFDGDIHAQRGWNLVVGQNIDAMKNFVNNTTTGSGTNPASGLNRAIKLFNEDYNPPEPSTRQKAVVLFTDGLPGHPTAANAHNAITAANQLKSQDVTIYTVAVHSSANPSAEPSTQPSTGYGSTTLLNAMLHAISSNYKTASSTNDYGFRITYGNRTTVDNQVVDYYFSANNPDDLNSKFENIAQQVQSGSTNIDLGTETVLKDVVTPYFTVPVNASAVNVYTVDCTGFTTVNGVSVPTWGNRVELPQATSATDADVAAGKKCYVAISGQTIDIKGFDYSKNYVAPAADNHVDPLGKISTGSFMGRKLVVEFVVTPTPDFIGGNHVVTNEENSGIYEATTDESGNTTYAPFENFEVPKVNVVFKAIYIAKNDQYIYLSNDADLTSLLTSFGIRYTFTAGGQDYEVNGYNNGYAVLRYKLTDPVTGTSLYYTIMDGQSTGTWSYVDGNGAVTESSGIEIRPYLAIDHTYEVSYEVFAKEYVNKDGTIKFQLDENGEETNTLYEPETTGKLYPTVYVFKPEVTFQDSKYKYMDQLAAADHYNTVNWVGNTQVLYKNPKFTWDLDHRPVGVMPSGERPTLTFEYDTDLESWINSANEVYTTTCVPVNVTKVTAKSTHGERDITSGTTSVRIECDCDVCKTTQNKQTSGLVVNHDPEFVIHVYDVHGKLAISKTVDGTGASVDDTFLFTITGPGITGKMQVILKGGQSVTINNLLVGDYVVKEETGWSWRYTCTESDATLEAKVEGNETAAVIFTNTLTTRTWLDGNAHADNNFAGSTTTEGGGK